MQSILRLSVVALLGLAACKPAEPAPAPAGPVPAPAEAPAVGMANPASVACEKDGGKLRIYDTPQGQIGICTTKDGRQCEEWALFRDGKCEAPPADAAPAPGQEG